MQGEGFEPYFTGGKVENISVDNKSLPFFVSENILISKLQVLELHFIGHSLHPLPYVISASNP
jgi:hypothetical protein